MGLLDDEVWTGQLETTTFKLPRDMIDELDLVARESTQPGGKKRTRAWVVKKILTQSLLSLREDRAKREAAHKPKR